MKRIHAFPLIELLVVVAIIALLIAILLPSMHKSIESARHAVCASNLHQTHTANLVWATDHFGNLVGGQPSFNTYGHYAVGVRSNAAIAEYGKYRKHGALARNEYTSAESFCCLSWTHPIVQFETHIPSDPGSAAMMVDAFSDPSTARGRRLLAKVARRVPDDHFIPPARAQARHLTKLFYKVFQKILYAFPRKYFPLFPKRTATPMCAQKCRASPI